MELSEPFPTPVADALYRLLRLLAMVGVFAEVAPRTLWNGPSHAVAIQRYRRDPDLRTRSGVIRQGQRVGGLS